MDKKIFEDLGLTENETTIYLSLIQYGESSANTVSEKTGLHRGYCYDTLSKLTNKGIVSYINKRNKKYFKGVHPKKFLEIIREKEQKVKELLPELLTMYKQENSDYEIKVLEGKEGMKTHHEELFSHFTGDKIPSYIAIGRKHSLLTDESMKYYFNTLTKRARKIGFFKNKKELNRKCKSIFDHSTRGEKRQMKKYGKHKYLPKECNTYGLDLIVVEDNVIIHNYNNKPYSINIKNKDIAKFFASLMDIVWKSCEK